MSTPEDPTRSTREKPPWWRDSIWLSMIAVCGLVVLGASLYWRAQQRRAAITLQAHLLKWQGALQGEEKPGEAVKAYRASIQWIHDQGAGIPELQAEIPEIQSRIDTILANEAKTKAKGD